MFRAMISPIFRSTRLCVTACGIMHPRCCRPVAVIVASSWLFILFILMMHGQAIIKFPECVFVALGIQHAMGVCHIIICDLIMSVCVNNTHNQLDATITAY